MMTPSENEEVRKLKRLVDIYRVYRAAQMRGAPGYALDAEILLQRMGERPYSTVGVCRAEIVRLMDEEETEKEAADAEVTK